MSEHELWNELGNLYFLSGAYNQAAHAYERSIQCKTSFGQPYSNLALTYVQQGKYDEAIDLYRRSIELLADDKEKAISLNRLGSVYRHLKDYSKAVIAFQDADELDPHSPDDFPAGSSAQQGMAPGPLPSSVQEEPVAEVDEVPAAQVIDQTVAEPGDPQQEPQVEWWDVDEKRVQSATQSQAPVAAPIEAAAEDLTTSWTPADLSEFQQDVSQMPQAGSLTTWGDADFEDDFELWSPLDPVPDLEAPDPDGENISTWLPIPEEEPLSLDELRVPPFVDELDAEIEPAPEAPEWNDPGAYHVVTSADFAPVLSAGIGDPESMDRTGRGDAAQNTQKTWETEEVDIDVQERATADFTLVSPELSTPVETETVACAAGPELVQAQTIELAPVPETPEPDRDDEEMHEIEMGIARFRRVVQLNPRNAHAWDALGTLFKSAGLYKDAILAYQQAISNDSSKSLYYHHLGLVYACEGRDEDAIGAFQRVIEIDPEYSLAHATLGGYYRKMGLEELAQKHIGKAMKNIFDSENEYNRACLEAICGNADQAIELLNVALKNKQTYVDWILRDPDLDFIRQDPRFKQLISEYSR